MEAHSRANLDQIAEALTWIITTHYPTAPKQEANPIRVIVGSNEVKESECGMNENIVSISDAGIKFWFRPYSEPGAPRFSYASINTLFDFMKIVIWPRVTGKWVEDRLLLDPEKSDLEKEATNEYYRLEAEGKSLNLKDIDILLSGKAELLNLYTAARNLDEQKLSQLSNELPGEISQIGSEAIQNLQTAISTTHHEKILDWKRFLIFRILNIAIMPLLAEGKLDWHSPEYYENTKKSGAQIEYIKRLAKRKYAVNFMKFCLSSDVIEINRRLFSLESSNNQNDYITMVTSFVKSHLETPEYANELLKPDAPS